MSLPWFRLYAETVDDAKLRLLAFEDRWHYIAILCCKGQGITDSTKPELLDRFIGAKLGLMPSEVAEVKRRLVEVDLIDQSWQPLAWEKRQYASDSAAERMRRYRERKKSNSETSPLRNSYVLDTDTDTDTEKKEDIDVGANAPSTHRKRSASRLPEGWEPSEPLTDYARKQLPNVDLAGLTDQFTDHWKAASGAKARKADWDAAWRTWVRNALQWGYPMLPLAPKSAQKIIRYDTKGNVING